MPDEMYNEASLTRIPSLWTFSSLRKVSSCSSWGRYPPQGHILEGSSGALSRYVTHSRAAALDQIIDRCTRRDPSARPSMADVAQELRTWLEWSQPQEEVDVSEIIAQFRRANQSSLDSQDQREDWIRRLRGINADLERSVVQWVYESLTAAGLRAEVVGWHEHNAWLERTRFIGSQPELANEQIWVVAEIGEPYSPTRIAVGLGTDVDVQGEFWCTGHVAWGDMESTATRQLQIDERTAHIESIEVDEMVAGLKSDIRDACGQMLRDLADRSSH